MNHNALPLALFSVHAQHPLVNGILPGLEFSARLRAVGEAYQAQYETHGRRILIYVAGSRHMYEGIADGVSLSAAGTQYLEDHFDIPRAVLHGEDWDEAFGFVPTRSKMQRDVVATQEQSGSVYCGQDEAVAATAGLRLVCRRNGIENGRLLAFCSPNQTARLTFGYLGAGLSRSEFGFSPVSTVVESHRLLSEVVLTAYTCIDPLWHGPMRHMLKSRIPD